MTRRPAGTAPLLLLLQSLRALLLLQLLWPPPLLLLLLLRWLHLLRSWRTLHARSSRADQGDSMWTTKRSLPAR